MSLVKRHRKIMSGKKMIRRALKEQNIKNKIISMEKI